MKTGLTFRKVNVLLATMLLLSTLLAGTAAAHVTVWPKETTQGSYEKFAVRVPSEKDAATIKIQLAIPDAVNISRVQPKAGWSYSFTKDDTDKIIGITWNSEGAGIGPTEFEEFYISGKVHDSAESLEWKAYQSYEDGEVVEWTGSADSDHPASMTQVIPGNSGDQGHGESAEQTQQTEADSEASSVSSPMPLYLSGAALIIALLALVIAFRKPSNK